MKRLLVLFGLIVLLVSCEEEGPYINFEPEVIDISLIDTTYLDSISENPDPKNVLIEDFTGVQCTNCPDAAVKIEAIKASHLSGEVVSVALHVTDQFGEKMSGSKEDYRIEEGREIFEMFGTGALPIGDVDRYLFSAETEILIYRQKWAGYTDQKLDDSSFVNIDLSTEYDSIKREVIVKVELHYTASVAGDNYLSVSILESNIVDWQKLPLQVLDSNYVFNHVLRDMLTKFNGKFLWNSPQKKRVFIKEFRITLEDHWKEKDISIIAFVHKGTPDFEVLQVEEIDLK